MKFELTKDQIIELALCINRCDLTEDEATRYALDFASECLEPEQTKE